ncbi:MAG: TlpA disulfide reductase family protein [Bacteroidota bacterium]
MKKLLLLIAGLAIISCATEPKIDYTIIAGKVENKKTDKIEVSGGNFSKEIQLAEDGTFRDTLDIETGYYYIFHDRYRTSVFITPGDSIGVVTDAKSFNKGVQYSGDGAAENTYLSEKLTESRAINFQELYGSEEADFFTKIQDLKTKAIEKVSNIENVNETFLAQEKRGIGYDYLAYVNRYTRYYPYFSKNKDYTPSEKIKELLANVDYDNANDYKSFQSYRQIAQDHYLNRIYTDSLKEQTLETVKTLQSQELKDDIADDLAFGISPSGGENEKLFKLVTELATDKELIEKFTTKYEKIQNLVKGKASPKFDYENHAGGNTTLADLQGKYVYIDVWATWCGPCLGEIPSLKKVEKQYHDKDIHFVSISIDEKDDYNTWKDMVKNKELGGIQLMADNAWKSEFVTEYAIEGIPRFILIDPSGKIVSADAPRPSNPKLIELFNELKI